LKNLRTGYEFYFNEFCSGTAAVIPPEKFEKLALRAQREVENFLCSKELSDAERLCVKLCICEVAEAMLAAENAEGIKSESVDGYSVTFADKSDVRLDVSRIIRSRLASTGLLYAGVE